MRGGEGEKRDTYPAKARPQPHIRNTAVRETLRAKTPPPHTPPHSTHTSPMQAIRDQIRKLAVGIAPASLSPSQGGMPDCVSESDDEDVAGDVGTTGRCEWRGAAGAKAGGGQRGRRGGGKGRR
eukprot:350015-Chlamydomonas_euryale.AAC.2